MCEQPQQPPQAEEESQEVEEEEPSLAELTVPPTPKMAVARDVEKRARQGTRGSVEVKNISSFIVFSAVYLFLVPLFLVPLSANLKMVIFGVK